MDAHTLDQIRWGLLSLILLIISIGLHEFGHAWVADLRGDPLPRAQGRVTLNPFAHTDPIGTIAIPAFMIFLPILTGSPAGFGLIGWGKPVQISLLNPRTRRMDDILITLAGPSMNIVLCLSFALIGGLGGFHFNDPKAASVVKFLVSGVFLNAGLAVFNLIPIPPLDGSRIALRLGIYTEEMFQSLARWGFLILLVMINISVVRSVMGDAIEWLAAPWFMLWDLLL
ncbi:MAG: site-2 protease family protein [Verrucomicrobia bacterium]|nr:site-2 protease family protein [Verrucomicrobiota bacterium]